MAFHFGISRGALDAGSGGREGTTNSSLPGWSYMGSESWAKKSCCLELTFNYIWSKSLCEWIQFQHVTYTVPPSQFPTVNIPDSCLKFTSIYHSSNPLCLQKHSEKLPEYHPALLTHQINFRLASFVMIMFQPITTGSACDRQWGKDLLLGNGIGSRIIFIPPNSICWTYLHY